VPNLSVHLIPLLEIVAALIAAPAVGLYWWRGVARRRGARLQARGDVPRPR
jgi:hypothetical protein